MRSKLKPLLQKNLERWLSGLKRRFAKSVTGKLVRRFESCPLRSLFFVFRKSLIQKDLQKGIFVCPRYCDKPWNKSQLAISPNGYF